MIQKMRRMLAALLVLVLCVPMNTVFAEGTVEHAKEEQSVLLQNEADDADNYEEAEVSQNPVELEGDENVNSSGKTEFPEESEIPAPTWKKDGIYMRTTGIMRKMRTHYIMDGFI